MVLGEEMTNEELDDIALRICDEAGAIDYMRTDDGEVRCTDGDTLTAVRKGLREVVSQAYEEAARVAENPETSYKRVWEACDVPEAMREGIATAIRALKDNLTERR